MQAKLVQVVVRFVASQFVAQRLRAHTKHISTTTCHEVPICSHLHNIRNVGAVSKALCHVRLERTHRGHGRARRLHRPAHGAVPPTLMLPPRPPPPRVHSAAT
jgi:hypothetical protein